jgi:hypothetical protein
MAEVFNLIGFFNAFIQILTIEFDENHAEILGDILI